MVRRCYDVVVQWWDSFNTLLDRFVIDQLKSPIVFRLWVKDLMTILYQGTQLEYSRLVTLQSLLQSQYEEMHIRFCSR